MKKLYFLPFIALLPLGSIAQTVIEEQNPLMVKKTATWCNPCGTWGWDLFTDIWNARESQSVMLEMHNSSSSELHSSAATAFYGLHEPRSSTPVFYVNTVNEVYYTSGGGISPSATENNVLSAIDSTNGASPVANSGITYEVNGSTLDINTKVKFFQNATGEYYLGVYLAENNVSEIQNGFTGTTTHKRIMRASADQNIEGSLITNGSVSSGDEFTNSHQINIDASWDTDNFYVFTVIWKKENGEYKYVNAAKQESALSIEDEYKRDVSMKIYPNAIQSGESFNIEIDNVLEKDASIVIYDQIGKKVKTARVGSLVSNGQVIKMNDTAGMNAGMYFVQLKSENGRILKSMKLVVKG